MSICLIEVSEILQDLTLQNIHTIASKNNCLAIVFQYINTSNSRFYIHVPNYFGCIFCQGDNYYYLLHITVNWFRQKPNSASLLRNGGGSGESLPISGSMVSLARPPLNAQPIPSRPVHVKRRVGYTLNRYVVLNQPTIKKM